MIIVRKIRLNDVQELVKFLIRNDLAKDIQRDIDYYICRLDGSLCGCGMMIKKDDYCIINNVIVDKEKRKQKLGSAIVKTMLNSAELSGAKTALCMGDVAGFSEYLNFKKVKVEELPENIKLSIKSLHNDGHIYAVSLIDYFESACK